MTETNNQLLTEVKNYKMPPAAAEFLSQNPPLIICAVTASGKNTVANKIIDSTNYRETVSHTTRPPRPGEGNGQHYWFVDQAKMLELVQAGAFMEVKAIHGQTVYGTSIEAYKTVIHGGHKPLLVIDVQGVEEILRGVPELHPFFILPPSYDEWMNRLHSRGVITQEDKAERLLSAQRELQTILDNSSYILVVNDDLEAAVKEIVKAQTSDSIQTKNRQLAKKILNQLK